MARGVLDIAICQFPVGRSIRRNGRYIGDYLVRAADAGADVVLFSECALSGYVGTDFPSFAGYDWDLLRAETQKVMELAGKLGIWVILGSTHRLTEPSKPHNSMYVIGPRGTIEDRYDKRFCTPGDLRRLTPGDRFVYFTVNGVKCSVLICFDLRFPELYRELYKQGVHCVLQSFYNARQSGPSVHSVIMRQTMQCHAATNHLWAAMANSSGWFSPYPSCFIQPDGRIIQQCPANRAAMILGTVDLSKVFYDPMEEFRDLAIRGILHNGQLAAADPRSLDRHSF